MDFNHGTPNGYNNHKCRCDDCRDDMTDATRKRKIAISRGVPGACEVCGVSDQPLHWDHCHASREHRGWLCRGCNSALGMFRDNPETLRSAIEYLEASWITD